MEEEKAAAYYDELTRKGGGAARFKQGLGFSSQSSDTKTDTAPARGSALPSSSSFLNSFVRASSPGKTSLFEKQAQLESIQNKLKKKQSSDHESRVLDHRSRDDSRKSRRRSSSGERERNSRKRSRSRDGRDSRRRLRSSSRERERYRRSERRRKSRSRSGSYSDEERIDRERRSSRRRRRSRSRSYSDEERKRSRGSREGKERARRSRSSSPREPKSEKSRSDRYGDRSKSKRSEKNADIDYSRLIDGYAEMTAAERIKAKMKLQLTNTAKKDSAIGIGAGWERFEFNKDAPLDDEEIEAGDDDKVLVKQIGQSFRFSAVEARREEDIKDAHDKAMFGAPTLVIPDEVPTKETEIKRSNENIVVEDLVSDKVLAKQQGSWRDRARKTS